MEPVDSKLRYRGMAVAAADAVAIQQQLANCAAAEQINTEEEAPAAALCNYLGSPLSSQVANMSLSKQI